METVIYLGRERHVAFFVHPYLLARPRSRFARFADDVYHTYANHGLLLDESSVVFHSDILTGATHPTYVMGRRAPDTKFAPGELEAVLIRLVVALGARMDGVSGVCVRANKTGPPTMCTVFAEEGPSEPRERFAAYTRSGSGPPQLAP